MKCARCLHKSVCLIRVEAQRENTPVLKCPQYYSWIRLVVFATIGVCIANVLIDVIF